MFSIENYLNLIIKKFRYIKILKQIPKNSKYYLYYNFC